MLSFKIPYKQQVTKQEVMKMPTVLEWLKDWRPPQSGKDKDGTTEEVSRLDSQFDDILAESEQEAKETMALVEGMEFGLDDKPSSSRGVGGTVGGTVGRTDTPANRPRLKGNATEWAIGGSQWAHQHQAARKVFESKALKPMWAIEGCVLLRDQGKCRVCREGVGKQWKVVRFVAKSYGGRWTEDNCVTICKHCETCWNPRKHFVSGTGLDGDFRRLRIYVMQRRLRQYRGCKDLERETMKVYRGLVDEEERGVMKDDKVLQRVKLEMQKRESQRLIELIRNIGRKGRPESGSGNESVGSTSTGKELGDG